MHIYVGNLARTVTEADLMLIFEGIGTIIYAKFVGFHEDAGARGHAFVDIEDEQLALNTIAAFNGKCFKGLDLILRPLEAREDGSRVRGPIFVAKGADHLHLVQQPSGLLN